MIEAPKEIYLAKDNHYNYLWCSNQRHYENDIKYIRADLVENEWQDIATAPKDIGQIIEIWWQEQGISRQAYYDHRDGRKCWISVASEFIHNPTHWKPLPQPPKEQK